MFFEFRVLHSVHSLRFRDLDKMRNLLYLTLCLRVVGLLMLVVLLDSCKKEKPAEQKADDDGAA